MQSGEKKIKRSRNLSKSKNGASLFFFSFHGFNNMGIGLLFSLRKFCFVSMEEEKMLLE